MSDEECSVAQIGRILADSTTRQILRTIREESMSAEDLSNTAETSTPTIYRRLNELRQCELLIEQTQLDPDDGHHHAQFQTDLERIIVELTDGDFRVTIDHHEAMADRFTRLIEGI